MKFLNYLVIVFIIGTVFSACDPVKKTTDTTDNTADEQGPKLVIVLSVDQMRFDYFTRFAPHFTGGLKRFWEEGRVYTDAHHNHAHTATGPGHATIGTGTFPAHSGIVGNEYYIPSQGKTIYCVDDDKTRTIGIDSNGNLKGKSPKNLITTSLGDWMKAKNAKSKVYGVAFKDRSAILMSGQNANRAFWFENISTKFVSSDYYKGGYPKWANAYVGRVKFKEEIEKGWYKKLEDAAYNTCTADDAEREAAGFQAAFPHTIKTLAPTLQAQRERVPASMLWQTPFGDAFALEFAKGIIENEELGADDIPDALMISCSTADAIGHHFGPMSQEVQDYYLHLDGYLDDFFKFLDGKVGRSNYVIALSADHGVAVKPEVAAASGKDAKRIPQEEYHYFINDAAKKVAKSLGIQGNLIANIGYDDLSLNYDLTDQKNISAEELRQKIAEAVKQIDFVEDVYTKEDLEGTADRAYMGLVRNSYHPKFGGEIKMRFKYGYLLGYSANGSTHGSPYDYDTHVPIILLGKNIPSGKTDERVHTVDIAPTLAKMVGATPLNKIDGKVIFGEKPN